MQFNIILRTPSFFSWDEGSYHLAGNTVRYSEPSQQGEWTLVHNCQLKSQGRTKKNTFLFSTLFCHQSEKREYIIYNDNLENHVKGLSSIVVKVKLVTVVEGDPKASCLIATTPRWRKSTIPFTGLLHFTLDPYLISLSVMQGSIKYHFLSLW